VTRIRPQFPSVVCHSQLGAGFSQLFESGVGDRGVADAEIAQIRKPGQMREALVRDAGVIDDREELSG